MHWQPTFLSLNGTNEIFDNQQQHDHGKNRNHSNRQI